VTVRQETKDDYQNRHATRESLLTGEMDYSMAKRFALEYVRFYGDPIKAYMKTFSVSRQRAHLLVDEYLDSACVKICIAKVTAPTETIASAGEVLASITQELREANESKDRLKAAEILLKVRGHMDRDKKSKVAGSAATQIVMLVKQYANASPAALEADLIGGGNALRRSIGEGSSGEDLPRGGQVDEPGEGDLLDAVGESVPREAAPQGDAGEGTDEYEVTL
jgi:hypothetical protein